MARGMVRSGCADFAAEEGDVVVAPVVVGGDERGLREAADGEADGHAMGMLACAIRQCRRRARSRRR